MFIVKQHPFIWKKSKQEIQSAVTITTTWRALVRLVFPQYKNVGSRIIKRIRNYCTDNNIDISHFRQLEPIPRLIKSCICCGKMFTYKAFKNKPHQQCCSHSCSNRTFPRTIAKSNDVIYKRICFSLNKKECIVCGETGIVDVHHINKNNQDNRPENLVPLCPTHHKYMHTGRLSLIIQPIIDDFVKKIKSADESAGVQMPGS